MKKTTFLKLVIGFSILGILIYKIGLTSILGAISKINPLFLLPILIAVGVVNLLGTWKLSLVFKQNNIQVPFLRLYHLCFLSTCLSLFILGRVGELLLIYFLKKEGVSLGAGSATVLIDKIIATANTFVLALIGIFIFFNISQSTWIVGLFLVGFLAVVFMIFSNFGRSLIRRFILKRWESHFAGFSRTLYSTVKNKRLLFYNFIIGLVKWFISASILYILFYSLQQEVSIFMVMLVTATLALVSLIPISINGLGLRESTGVVLFSLVGIPKPITASAFLMLLIINYSISSIYVLLFFEKGFNIKQILE